MKKTAMLLCAIWFSVSVTCAFAGDKAPQKVVDLAATLAKYGTDAVIVAAVKEENARGKTLSQIQEADNKWMAVSGVNDFMRSLMDSECAKRLKEITKTLPQIVEIFAMDNQGANVCMTNKTSDYWQGDEDKFIESYKGGKGAIHISEVNFDKSISEEIVQVSVPVKDGSKVIGAITFGVNPRKMK